MAVGTKDGLNNIVDWVDVGKGNKASLNVSRLVRGQEYYLSLVAVDNAGNRSAVVTSPAWQAEPLVNDFEVSGSNLNLNSSSYKIFRNSSGEKFISGGFTKYGVNNVGCEGRVTSAGVIDTQFYGSESYRFCSGNVKKAAVQTISSVDYTLVAGTLTQISGVKSAANFFRLKPNGELDSTFSQNIGTGFTGGAITDFAISSDNKIIVVGSFTVFNGASVGRIVRLNVDGTLDSTFAVGTGFDAVANSVTITPAGKVVVGGTFTKVNNVSVPRFIVMLNTNGSVDSTFSTNAGVGFDQVDAYATVSFVGLSSGGKILVGGRFTKYGATMGAICSVMLNTDGTLDTTYRSNIFAYMSCVSITKIWEITDSYIYTGSISTYNAISYNGILKVNKATGAADTTFRSNLNADIANHSVRGVFEDGGKIILVGGFNSVNGDTNYDHITRVSQSGIRDTTFGYTKANGFIGVVDGALLGSDGKYRIFGNLDHYGGTAAAGFLKLKADNTVDVNFASAVAMATTGMVNSVYYPSGTGRIFIRGYSPSLPGYKSVCVNETDGGACTSNAFENLLPDSIGRFSDESALVSEAHPTIDDLTISRRLNKQNVMSTSFDTNYDNLGIIDPNYLRRFSAINDKVLLTGEFIDVGSITIAGLFRLNGDGTADTAFNAKVGAGFSDDSGPVSTGAVYSNKMHDLFVAHNGGSGIKYNNDSVPTDLMFVKLNWSGEPDLNFMANASQYLKVIRVDGMTFLPDNRVLIWGDLLVNGQSRNLVRLENDGHVDLKFDSITQLKNSSIFDVSYDDDDNLLIAASGTISFKGQILG